MNSSFYASNSARQYIFRKITNGTFAFTVRVYRNRAGVITPTRFLLLDCVSRKPIKTHNFSQHGGKATECPIFRRFSK